MKYTNTLERADGSTVALTAEYFPNPNNVDGKIELDFYAHVTRDGETELVRFAPQDKSLHGLSVEEYQSHGRTGLLAVVSSGEILKHGEMFRRIIRHAEIC